jgi:glycosyltransferase involved in cell wall biosynthesis
VAQQHKVDVVNAHNYEGLLVALAAGVRPIVYHAHNAMADELPHYFRTKRLAARFGTWLDRTFPKRADRIVVPHERLAEYLVDSGCARGTITVIPPAVDVNEFEPCESQIETPPVLYTGNLDRYQNLDLLRRVMGIIQEAVPNAKLMIATSDPRPIPWATVIRTPNFAALKKTLHQDSIFAVPRVSWSGYPIKLLNAMAAGQAIVCCRSAAHPLSDGHDGLVVEDNDARAFADAILRLMRDAELRRGLGERARETAIEKHGPSLSVNRLYSVLAGVCAGE